MAPLNPHALEYVPSIFKPVVLQSAEAGESSSLPASALHDAPKEVLAGILAHVSSAEDLCSCIATCRALRDAAADAPLAVRVPPAVASALGSPDAYPKLALLEGWLVKRCPSATALDLSGLPLGDASLARLLRRLPRLQWLGLEGCKKLTAASTRALLALLRGGGRDGGKRQGSSDSGDEGGGGSSDCGGGDDDQQGSNAVSGAADGGAAEIAAAAAPAAPRLRFVNLQRCFQLTGSSLDDLLEASQLPGSCLEGAAASHLTLEGGGCAACASAARRPAAGAPCACGRAAHAPLPRPLRPRGSSLRMVALSNSVLTPAALLALADACPGLEYLFLGGSTLRGCPPPPPRRDAEAAAPAQAAADAAPPAAAAADGAGGGAGGAAPAAQEPRQAGEWLDAPARVARLEQRLGLPAELPPWALGAGGCTDPAAALELHLASSSGAGGEGGEGGGETRRHAGLQLLSPMAAEAARARGAALAAAALSLPRLRVVEVTFFDPVTQAWLRVALAAAAAAAAAQGQEGGGERETRGAVPRGGGGCGGGSGGEREARSGRGGGGPRVWDFCETASVRDAVAELARAPRASAPALARALRAAVSCSSRSRLTPLHAAAEAGRCGDVRALIFDLGACVSPKDAHGQQPLFLACEAGHAGAAAALLRGGAVATAMTKSGESPLYIASLKGHRSVVTLLLRHFVGARVPWYCSQLYGDAFTPLMAAAVGNRLEVAALLLQEAREHAPALAAATNRYGLSAWHIAARKGSKQMMQLLATAAA